MSDDTNISQLQDNLRDLLDAVDNNNPVELSNAELLALLKQPGEAHLDLVLDEGVVQGFMDIEIDSLEQNQHQQQQHLIWDVCKKENISGLANLSNIDDIEPMQL